MTESQTDKNMTVRGRLTLLLVVLLFFGPVVVALVLYMTGSELLPDTSTANGELIQPVVPLPDTALRAEVGGDAAAIRGRWAMIYLENGRCETACRESLYRTRQVRRALGKDMDRIRRYLLLTGEAGNLDFLREQHPDLLVLRIPAGDKAEWLQLFEGSGARIIFLADPLGNLLMRYPPDAEMRGIHNDLKKLLTASRIG